MTIRLSKKKPHLPKIEERAARIKHHVIFLNFLGCSLTKLHSIFVRVFTLLIVHFKLKKAGVEPVFLVIGIGFSAQIHFFQKKKSGGQSWLKI